MHRLGVRTEHRGTLVVEISAREQVLRILTA